jgi:hypothetical protein
MVRGTPSRRAKIKALLQVKLYVFEEPENARVTDTSNREWEGGRVRVKYGS